MKTFQRYVIAVAIVAGLTLFSASTAKAQYSVSAFSPHMVHTYSAPYVYYPPIYQAARPTYYVQPNWQPYTYYPQTYYSPTYYPQTYNYYPRVWGGRRFVTGMNVWVR